MGAVIGVLSALAALGTAQLMAGIVGGASSPMLAVGAAAIDATPAWLREFAIRTFGTRDKFALLVGIAVVLAAGAIAIGIVSARRPRAGLIGLVVFGAIGVAAALTRPASGPVAAIPSVVGTAVGLFVYRRLMVAAALPEPWAVAASPSPPRRIPAPPAPSPEQRV